MPFMRLAIWKDAAFNHKHKGKSSAFSVGRVSRAHLWRREPSTSGAGMETKWKANFGTSSMNKSNRLGLRLAGPANRRKGARRKI